MGCRGGRGEEEEGTVGAGEIRQVRRGEEDKGGLESSEGWEELVGGHG